MTEEKSCFRWTGEAVARLRVLLEAKKSFAEIANLLSVEFGLMLERGAVAGKVSRLGWQGVGNPRGPRRPGPVTRAAAPPKAYPPRKKRLSPRSPAPVASPASSRCAEAAPRRACLASVRGAGTPEPPPSGVPTVSLPVLFRRPVGILEVRGCRATVGADAAVTGRWLFCDQPRVEGGSYCVQCAPKMLAPRKILPGIPADNHVQRRAAPREEAVQPLDRMMGAR